MSWVKKVVIFDEFLVKWLKREKNDFEIFEWIDGVVRLS